MGHPTTVMPPRNPRTQNPPQPPAEPATTAPVAPAPDLTISKVFAVAGAGATSAVLGSLFGVAGTVLGAAIGAVLTTVATSLYQRSLERARTAVTSRLRGQQALTTDDLDTVVMAPPARPGEQPTELIAPADLPSRSRRRVVGYVLATVMGFAIALGLVTGIEALKGSTLLRGESGTSVGRVLQGGPHESPTPAPDPSDSKDGDERSGKSQYDHNSETDDPTTEPTRTGQPTSGPAKPSATPTTEPTGGLGGLLDGSNGGANGSGNADQGGNG